MEKFDIKMPTNGSINGVEISYGIFPTVEYLIENNIDSISNTSDIEQVLSNVDYLYFKRDYENNYIENNYIDLCEEWELDPFKSAEEITR